MATNTHIAIAARKAALDAAMNLANSGTLVFYDGAQPANADTAVTTQNILATLTLANPAFTAATGASGATAVKALTLGFPIRKSTTSLSAYAYATGVPIEVVFAGSPAATVVNGSAAVTMSGNITAQLGDLVFFDNGGGWLEAYEVGAPAPVASPNLVLTTPYQQTGGSGVATTTIPLTHDSMDLPALTGLPATGYTLNMSGILNVSNGAGADRQIGIYVAGNSEYTQNGGEAQFENLSATTNDVAAVPFNVDLVFPNPSPTTFTPHVFAVAESGSAGDVTFGKGSSMFIAVQVA